MMAWSRSGRPGGRGGDPRSPLGVIEMFYIFVVVVVSGYTDLPKITGLLKWAHLII